MAGGWTDAAENALLDYELKATAYTPGDKWAALFTVSPTDAGAGGTEFTGGAYARQQLARATGTWAAAAGAGSTNTPAVTFPQATANLGRALTLCLMDAATAGTVRHVLPMVTGSYKNFAVHTATDITNNDIGCPVHGFVANDVVRFFAVGGTLPTGLATDTRYFVIATGLATDTFRVSTTQGGAALDITAAGAGEVAKDASFDVVLNSQLSFAAGQVLVSLD